MSNNNSVSWMLHGLQNSSAKPLSLLLLNSASHIFAEYRQNTVRSFARIQQKWLVLICVIFAMALNSLKLPTDFFFLFQSLLTHYLLLIFLEVFFIFYSPNRMTYIFCIQCFVANVTWSSKCLHKLLISYSEAYVPQFQFLQ